ncbi:hypothetical protein NAJ18_004406 [Salmonella enterica]|nr:hypothetical protein [Salmonella enterica]
MNRLYYCILVLALFGYPMDSQGGFFAPFSSGKRLARLRSGRIMRRPVTSRNVFINPNG